MGGWWGEPWPSAALPATACEDPARQVAFPKEGELCLLCNEQIEPDDSGTTIVSYQGDRYVDRYAHKECSLRGVLGNHIHVRGLCSYVGECAALSKLSYREESLAVWDWVEENGVEAAVR